MVGRCACLLAAGLSVACGFHLPASSGAPLRVVPSAARRSSAVDSDSSPGVVAASPAGKEDLFDWNKQWYPVLSLKDTDPGRAHPVQLLGKDLVVWRNKEERWSCFDDRCPHRAAPLTEGRIEDDGSLLCAYHAWRFDADGKCLSIPQSDRGGKDEAQPKACAKIYPTQVAQGMVWVWGENGPDAGLESTLTPAQLIPDLDDKEGIESGRVKLASVGQNDLAYGWDTFMENVVDPSHVTVSHHGVAGDRYTGPSPIDLKPSARWPVPTKDGFEFEFRDDSVPADSTVTFRPPCLVINEAKDSAGKLLLILYGTPTRPGWVRLLGRSAYVHTVAPNSKEAKEHAKEDKRNGVKKSRLQATANVVTKLPSWLQHVTGSLFLHQDLVFLHHQEKILASAGSDSSNYGQAVFVPAAADRAVLALRQWITKHGSGGPAWDKNCNRTLPPRERNREALFNVYENHTKSCTSCQGALKNVTKMLTTAKTAAVISFTWAVLRGARAVGTAAAAGSPSAPVINAVTVRAMLPAVALAFASVGAVKILEKLRGMFYTYSFHHQDSP
ncbi:unnamed protein product [Ectocarpus sp. 13 AM-2016]